MSAVRWKGGWSGSGSPGTSLITYYNGDSVLYLNITYTVQSNVLSIPIGSPPPPSDMSNWDVLVAGGSDGSSGSSGSSGTSGTSGSSGSSGTSGTSGQGVPAWTSAGALTIHATTSPISGPAFGVTTQNNISYRQVGVKEWEIVLTYIQTATTGAGSGSGDYLIVLPNGLSFDTTLPSQQVYTGNVASTTWVHTSYVIPNGNGMINNGSIGGHLFPMVYSDTKFRVLTITYGSAVQCWGSGYYSIGGDNPKVQLTFRFTST